MRYSASGPNRFHVLCSSNPPVISPVDIVFYDGHCGLCHGTVKFALRHDREGAFRFAPLNGSTFRGRVPVSRQASMPDSIVVLTANGNLLVRSDAFIYILGRLGGVWRAQAAIVTIVPRPLRDAAYNLIARVRYRIFGRRNDVCPIVPNQLRDRFLD
ncbi:MAG: thiol-disulfide oxidoreductase DCC family protein [Candidatus Acidiferrales bacterium]